MTQVCQLFDAAAGWEERVASGQLLERLPRDRFDCRLAALDPRPMCWLREFRREVTLFPRLGAAVLAGPLVRRFVVRRGIDVVHAWGLRAALAAGAAGKTPVAVELFDPRLSSWDLKVLRTLARSACFAVVCSCQIVHRRLIEGGIRADACVLIRPGVDFAVINQARRGPLRGELGLSPADFVVITPPGGAADGECLEAALAAKLVDYLAPPVRIIVPGARRSDRRARRFAGSLPGDPILVHAGRQVPFEELLAISDALVVATRGDTPSTAIAWAMAAGTAVVAGAVHSVAELIANKLNGLLYKPQTDRTAAVPVARLLQDRDAQRQSRETARGQAYEVFGLRRFVDQHARLYANLFEGEPPGDGIVDPATMV